MSRKLLSDDHIRIIEARHHDPFSILGKHPVAKGRESVRAYLPYAEAVRIADSSLELQRIEHSDFFAWEGPAGSVSAPYQLQWLEKNTQRWHQAVDPYCLPSQLTDFDLHLFQEGKHWHAYRFLGARLHTVDGISGVLFATWAPNAERVSVVGEFNRWDGRCHPLRVRGGSGVWELFIPGLCAGQHYKFEIRNRQSGAVMIKSDPYGRQFELRPGSASVIAGNSDHAWQDADWMQRRQQADWLHRPLSIYEVHLGSWQRNDQGGFLSYDELAQRLGAYAQEMGFTHVELLPISEHPLDASWGYQTLGSYAPTSRFGGAEGFRRFVDHLHQLGIGVILDWVPAHFPKDAHGLAWYDGTPLYEHEDPRRGEHRDWGTLIYNYGRSEVKNYLLSSADYWLEEFQIDALRVDAVASMLYLDYSRQAGDWLPNMHGGNENLEAIAFLRQLNEVTHSLAPGSMVIAEESTAWPQVTRPTWLGGLGFSMKWNMGWMHDTLSYMSKDPVHRTYHHDQLTFGLLYAFTENFVLPFSHDEVVHGKKSLLYKMPGDEWQRFANLRLLYTYMFTYPGKKLLFMGCEFGQGREWNYDTALDWYVLQYPYHQGVKRLVADLNALYTAAPALYRNEFDHSGFQWIDCHDARQSVISYLRRDPNGGHFIVVINFTPVPRSGYRIGVPQRGVYREVINSDSRHYGGSNTGNGGGTATQDSPWMGLDHSLTLTLPPLAAIVLAPVEQS